MTERGTLDRHLAGAQALLGDLAPSRQRVADLQTERTTVAAQLTTMGSDKERLAGEAKAWDERLAALEVLKQQIAVQ
jgi:hypothetical protein